MSDAVYRFLPFAHRGLAAALPAGADGTAPPARADVPIEVVVGGAGPIPTSARLYGPGDVVGLDPTVIVRTVPRAGTTNAEPNYLAAIDFDDPELPWLFTPQGPPPSGRLHPWLVLVVVRDRPGVSLTVPAGGPLPHLHIESGAAAELPDLADSWAWAHVQLLEEDAGTSADAVGAGLRDHPDRNVSRLVCPRRLEANVSYIACVVPAWDAGVTRGLGTAPDAPTLAPAWSTPDSIELPVYYHWRFGTGPQGDFESLARRLKPYEASARIGRAKMHVGDASPFADLPQDDPERFLDMDGALQAPAVARAAAAPPVPDPSLADVPARLVAGLQEVARVLADAADGVLDGQAPDAAPAVGPPVYAGAHLRRTTVTDADPTWFRELNTDPRGRVAAGLGAEVMRTYQEEVMEACWKQVGDVVAVETALSRARLSLEAGRRLRERHLLPLPPGRLMQVAAPLADRTLVGGLTITSAIAPTSFPDRATDAAMRRMTAPRGRVLAGVARRARTEAAAAAARAAGERMVATLAAGRPDVDATRFPVPGIEPLPGALPPAEDGTIDLSPLGAGIRVPKDAATALVRASRDLAGSLVPPAKDLVIPRADLRTTGMLSQAHVAAAERAAAVTAGATPASVLDAVLTTAAGRPGAAGYVIEGGGSIVVRPLGLRGDGSLVVLTAAGEENVPVAHIDPRLLGDAREVGDLIARIPDGTIPALVVRRRGGVLRPIPTEVRPSAAAGGILVRPGGGDVVIERPPLGGGIVVDRPPVGGGVIVDRPPVGGGVVVDQPPAGGAPTVTMPPLVTDAGAIARYEQAAAAVTATTALGDDPVALRTVPFALSGAVAATLQRSDPVTVHPARLETTVLIGGHGVASVLADPSLAPSWRLAALFDRVMAYPKIDAAAYTYLAAYDRTRFCPGIDEVPPESITLLETNPRFIAAFMGGINHETARELLWRSYPTDGRGTPWRKFWRRADGGPDIHEMHLWGARGRRDDLPAQTTEPRGNLVLLLRGDLLRRYPHTMAIAVRAVRPGNRQLPSDDPVDLRLPVFAGAFDPDVSFFGFPLVSADLTAGEGWFFGLMEPVTEPRFGFDETVGRETERPTGWNDVAWPDLLQAPGHLPTGALAALGLAPAPARADGVAAAAFQRPFKLLVHARHLVLGI